MGTLTSLLAGERPQRMECSSRCVSDRVGRAGVTGVLRSPGHPGLWRIVPVRDTAPYLGPTSSFSSQGEPFRSGVS